MAHNNDWYGFQTNPKKGVREQQRDNSTDFLDVRWCCWGYNYHVLTQGHIFATNTIWKYPTKRMDKRTNNRDTIRGLQPTKEVKDYSEMSRIDRETRRPFHAFLGLVLAVFDYNQGQAQPLPRALSRGCHSHGSTTRDQHREAWPQHTRLSRCRPTAAVVFHTTAHLF